MQEIQVLQTKPDIVVALSGEIAAEIFGEYSPDATDITSFLADAILSVQG